MLETKIQASGVIEQITVRGDYSQVTIKNNESQYETFVSFDFKSEKFDRHPIKQGDKVDCSGYVSSREWNGKYYTSIRGTFLKVLSESDSHPEPESSEEPFKEEPF